LKGKQEAKQKGGQERREAGAAGRNQYPNNKHFHLQDKQKNNTLNSLKKRAFRFAYLTKQASD
jgi:hypothetical protein